MGQTRRFESSPSTSSLPPTPDILLSRSKGAGGSRRANGVMVTPLSDRQRWGINAGASPRARLSAPDVGSGLTKRRRAIRLRSACRPHGADEAKRPQISGVYHWAGAARLRRQLRQLGEVHRHPPRLVTRQPIWSPSDATQQYVRIRGRSGSARLALETTLMTHFRHAARNDAGYTLVVRTVKV
jgi:hypothetical protein